MNERLKQFDVLKGIGIICVLLGHAVIPAIPKEIIYGFHMPLFFLCSGVFFKEQNLKTAFINNCRQLLIPYLFFLLILNAGYFFVNLHANNSLSLSIQEVYDGLSIFDPHSHNYLTLWFLLCLFLVRTLYAIIYKIVNNQIVMLVVGGGMYVVGNIFITTPLFLDTAISMLIFYGLGSWFYKSGFFKRIAPIWVSICLFIVYSIFIVFVNPYVEIKDNIYPWYLLPMAISAIWSLYQISWYVSQKLIHTTKILQKCGESSLALLGLHRPLWLFVFPICLKLKLSTLLFVTVEILSALIIILPIYSLLRRYAPILIGQKKK